MVYISVMKWMSILLLLLTICGVLSLASSFVGILRGIQACFFCCCGNPCHLAMIIWLTIVRAVGGIGCASLYDPNDISDMGTFKPDQYVVDDSMFLRRMMITMWVMIWFHCCFTAASLK